MPSNLKHSGTYETVRRATRNKVEGFSGLGASPQPPEVVEGMGVYRPMRKAGHEDRSTCPILIVTMSPPGYSLARVLLSRAGLRLTWRAQFTVASLSIPDVVCSGAC